MLGVEHRSPLVNCRRSFFHRHHAANAGALQDLAQNPQRLGATLGMLGVLHTWSRTLIHHPHVHFLVPGGGLSLDQRTWVPARKKFLLPVQALSDHGRTLFRRHLARHHPAAMKNIPAPVLSAAEQAAWQPPAALEAERHEPADPDVQPATSVPQRSQCPHCGGELVRVARWRAGHPLPRPPPGRAPPAP